MSHPIACLLKPTDPAIDPAIGAAGAGALPSSDIVGAIAAVTNSDVMAKLSPVVQPMIQALDVGIGSALGLGTSLSSAGLSAVTSAAESAAESVGEEVGSTVAEIAGDVVEMIPFIGPIIKAAVAIITAVVQALEPKGEMSTGQECQALSTAFKPQQTGSELAGGMSVPADMFACVNPVMAFWLKTQGDTSLSYFQEFAKNPRAAERKYAAVNWFDPKLGGAGVPAASVSLRDWSLIGRGYGPHIQVDPYELPAIRTFYVAGPTVCRSAIGMALMQVTEGMVCDIDDFDWNYVLKVCQDVNEANTPGTKGQFKSASHVREMWKASLDADREMASKQWAIKNPHDKKRGLPKEWAERFRKVRKGIEACYGPLAKPGTTTDGGTSLWLAYVDLLLQAYDKGYLSDDYIAWLFTRQSLETYKRFGNPASTEQVDTLSDQGPLSSHNAAMPLYWWLNWKLLSSSKFNAGDVRSGDATANYTATPPTWIWFGSPCPENFSAQVSQMVSGWRTSVHPYYTAGKEAEAKLTSKTSALKAKVKAKYKDKNVPKSKDRKLGAAPADSKPSRFVWFGLGALGMVGGLVGLAAWQVHKIEKRLANGASHSGRRPINTYKEH